MALSGDAQQGTLISSSGSVNSLNDQSEQISSRFWYDELGRLILSQNARQFVCTDCPVAQQEIGAKAYSYTLYDEVGRIVQVGELLSTIEPTTYKNRSQIKYADHRSFVENTSNYRHQVTTTKYDRTDRSYNNFSASYLRNRVAYTTYQQNPNAQVQESHYSYDVHGNVKSMLQVIRGDGEELTKRIDYEYDLVSGKVNKVTYQKDNSDQFIHQYTYDGDNRIIQVATSTDDIVYTKEATYQYYAHGPLARINYGELNVETQDFAYTIQGWIKQVQGQVFAYALGYNNTDYSPIGAANQLATPIATNKGLYNGNIATMSSKTQAIDAGNPWVQQFTYDQLNRIKTSTTQGNNQYATSYSYDANGNILNLTRKNNAGGDIDNLTYNYENKSSGYQRNTNRLRSVDDAVATTQQSDDIEDQQEDNYRYDATGNLIYDRSEEIESIQWTVSGKVHKVIRAATSTKPNLEFTYDASGNRIAKKVIQPNGDYKTTFYVRDASGNVMAVYKTSGTTNLTLEEQHIYGSSRLGIFKKDKNRSSNRRVLGERRYELTDHLGNVRVVMSDYKRTTVIVLSATDYYPFGMVARTYTSPEEYRYGFNGQEREDDAGSFDYDFGARMYDSRLGRFLSIDPLYKTIYNSSYYTFGDNSPISKIDQNGHYALFIHFKLTKYYLSKLGISDVQANLIAHYASTFSDNPAGIKRTTDLSIWSLSHWKGLTVMRDNVNSATSDNKIFDKIGGKFNSSEVDMLKYQTSIDYTLTERSQSEDYQAQAWHATRTESEKNALTATDAIQRAQLSAWANLFESAKYGHMNNQVANSIGIQKLGLALHGFQDINAHQGCIFNASTWNLGGYFSTDGNEHDLHNDSHPDESMFARAQFMTESAIIIHQLLTGDYKNLKNGQKLNVEGMTTEQYNQFTAELDKAGYTATKENGQATLVQKTQ